MYKTGTKIFVILFLAMLTLSACGGGEGEEAVSDADLVLTQAADIANQGLTKTAEAQPAATNTPAEPTFTVTVISPDGTETVIPTDSLGGAATQPPTFTALPTGQFTATATPFPSPTKASSGAPCNRANLEYENVPDGTRFLRNKQFTKVWRLKNIGSCTWTPAYSLKWVAGDLIGAPSVVPLTDVDIPPNGYVEAQVTFQTGLDLGVFTSYWMLLSGDGVLFGLGADGTSWFWVEIEVYDPG